MKPDWDKLTEEFKDSPTSGVYDVDCTTDGQALCEKHGIQGYPTIKWGDPDNLQDYQGGREYEELKAFADENLGPTCGYQALDLCDEETKALIEGFLAMSSADLKAKLQEVEKAHAAKEKAYNKKRRKFESKYEDFKSESSEEEAQAALAKEEEAKFEKAKEKLSKAEISKRQKKMEKAKARAAKFEKKRASMEAELEKFNEEQEALATELKKTGAKQMKAVLKKKAKEEL